MPPNASTLRAAWHAVADVWPKDHFRPNHQFSNAIRQAADRSLTGELSTTQVWKAQEAAASLRRLVENNALKKHPMTDRTTKPASAPKHYSRILDSAQRAERGEVFKKQRFSWFRWK
ncbi:hypothetical protein JCM10207_004598 [Rhodosporidiobolus poonsookiae]